MDIYIVDNNSKLVRPWVTVAINPVCRRILWCRISLKPLEKEKLAKEDALLFSGKSL